MYLKYLFFVIFFFISTISYSQIEPVNVADLKVKISGLSQEELYYSFAEGDQIIFNFEEVNEKPLKDLEIVALPANSKYNNFKVTKVENIKITVYNTGVYKFKFNNSSLAKRVCKINIQRIPKYKELISFNTNWKWKTIYDTTYIPYTADSLAGYDTINYKETVKEPVKTEQKEVILFDKNQRVGDKSMVIPRNSYTYLEVNLPPKKSEPNKTERNIAWAYWIGVGEEAQKAYKENVRSYGKVSTGVASNLIHPLAGLAIGAITELSLPSAGDNVHYYFIRNEQDAKNFKNGYYFEPFDQGNGKAAYGRNTEILDRKFFIGLHNDNNVQDIDVNVKIVVIKEIKYYEDKVYDRQKVEPKYVKIQKHKTEIKSHKIRVPADH